jgi:protein-arginine kinase activator protein McsA
MIHYAEDLNFEEAAKIRDAIKKLENKELGIGTYLNKDKK